MTAGMHKQKLHAPVPLAKGLDPAKPRNFAFEIMAYTDVIGGNAMGTNYAKELLTIDPFAELEDNCLIVMQFSEGSLFMARWSKTGKDKTEGSSGLAPKTKPSAFTSA
jgi:hypothetical protein